MLVTAFSWKACYAVHSNDADNERGNWTSYSKGQQKCIQPGARVS